MLRIVDFLKRDVRIVSVTGGPGYGKSSVAIVSSHRLESLITGTITPNQPATLKQCLSRLM